MSQSPANKFIAAIIVASKGEDFVPNTLKQNLGEHTLWTGQGSYHETGRTASTYVGGSSGVSIPIGGGISFRVRAIKGQVIPDEKLQSDNVLGVGLLATERLVFSVPTHTREWNFDKLLMLSTNESDLNLGTCEQLPKSDNSYEPRPKISVRTNRGILARKV